MGGLVGRQVRMSVVLHSHHMNLNCLTPSLQALSVFEHVLIYVSCSFLCFLHSELVLTERWELVI